MEHRLCCQISEQDGMLRIKDVLEKKMGLTRRQISRLKYIPDGIMLNRRQVRTDAPPSIWAGASSRHPMILPASRWTSWRNAKTGSPWPSLPA